MPQGHLKKYSVVMFNLVNWYEIFETEGKKIGKLFQAKTENFPVTLDKWTWFLTRIECEQVKCSSTRKKKDKTVVLNYHVDDNQTTDYFIHISKWDAISQSTKKNTLNTKTKRRCQCQWKCFSFVYKGTICDRINTQALTAPLHYVQSFRKCFSIY